MAIWPFGKDEEDENAAPNMAILEVPGEYKHGMRYPGEFIRIRFNEDGSIADREKVPRDEAKEFIRSGEAFEVNEKQMEKIRKGKPVSEIYKETLETNMKEEEEEAGPVEEGYIDKKRKESPLGGDARKKRLDEAIEGDNGY